MRKIIWILFIISSHAIFGQKEIREVKLSGRGYELGLQHGKLLKKEIGEIVTKMKENASTNLNTDFEKIEKDFFAYANFDESIKKYTPDLYEEVRGIAEGSNQTLKDIMILNLLDEFWVYIDNIENHHCTSMGVPLVNGSASYIAQNMDIENYTNGYQTLIRLERTKNRPEQLILTHPGLIGLTGMNEMGIGACMNTLMQLKASSSGLPVAFIVRRIINSTDKEELLHFVQTVSHASGQNYIIGIRGEVFDFEASANEVVQFDPKNANGTVYHTNHPIVNEDMKPWFGKYDPKLGEKPMDSNSYIRFAAAESRIAKTQGIDDILIKQTLKSKDDANNPVCRTIGNGNIGFTFSSVIMAMTGKPFMQITAGSPDEFEYIKIEFSKNKISRNHAQIIHEE